MKRLGQFFAKYPTACAFALFALLGAATSSAVPWSDDARFYVRAAATYAQWFEGALIFDAESWNFAAIDRAFQVNSEHPPIGKYIMGLGWLVLHQWTGLLDEVAACRAPITLLWALMCALAWVAVGKRTSWWAGAFAGLALATMPRLLYHAHAETLDLAITALSFFTVVALFECIETPTRKNIAGTTLLFALALGTKLNAPFILLAAVFYSMLLQPVRRVGLAFRLPAVPTVLLTMAVVSPLVTWALWPWMWSDTLHRLNAYLLFHLNHYSIFTYFGGTLYTDTFAPVTAPLIMLLKTTPEPILLAAALGMLRPLWALAGQFPGIGRRDSATEQALHGSATLRFALMLLLQGAVQLIMVSLPSVPKYGGVKLFLPLMPMMACLAGLGLWGVYKEMQRSVPKRWQTAAKAGTLVAALLPGVFGMLAYHGAWLSYYNGASGGVRGATEAGYERQYYDLAWPDIPEVLSEHLGERGSVAFLPNGKEYGPYMARWQQMGLLPRGIRMASVERADVVILTHERRWRQYPELIAQFRTRELLYRHTVHGVPMFSAYGSRSR